MPQITLIFEATEQSLLDAAVFALSVAGGYDPEIHEPVFEEKTETLSDGTTRTFNEIVGTKHSPNPESRLDYVKRIEAANIRNRAFAALRALKQKEVDEGIEAALSQFKAS